MTTDLIRELAAGKVLYDRGEKQSVDGLHVRALGSKKVFMLYYRSREGKQRRPKIGEFGQITLHQARTIARKILDRVASGEDPQAVWAKARAELTVRELFSKAWDVHWSKSRFMQSGHSDEVAKHWRRNIEPYFGTLRLSEIAPADVRKWHHKFEDTPYTGNRALEILKKMFVIAESEGLIPRGSSPTVGTQAFVELKRKRYASEEEIQKIIRCLEVENSSSPYGVAFIYWVLFTGSRPSALERATKEQLQRVVIGGETYGVLSFKGKTSADLGEEEVLIAPPKAMEILDNLPPRLDGKLFGCKAPTRLWNKIRKEAGCKDLWLRDLRRTYATVGLSNGVGQGVIGELLNHRSIQTTKIYARLMQGSKLQAAKGISDTLEKIISGGR